MKRASGYELNSTGLEIRLRSAQKHDYEFYGALLEKNMGAAVWRNRGYDAQRRLREYERGFAHGDIYIIECTDRPIGFFQIEKKEHSYIYITELQIVSDYRRKGIGTCVLDLIETMALKEGFEKIRLEVFLDNPAKKLYERKGYMPFEFTKHRSVLMEKFI